MASVRLARDVSFAIFLTAFMLSITAFVSPFWYGNDNSRRGLFYACFRGACGGIGETTSTYLAAQILIATSVGLEIGALCSFIHWFCTKPGNFRRDAVSAWSVSICAGVIGLAGICTLVVSPDNLDAMGWCWWLFATGAMVQLLDGAITMPIVLCSATD